MKRFDQAASFRHDTIALFHSYFFILYFLLINFYISSVIISYRVRWREDGMKKKPDRLNKTKISPRTIQVTFFRAFMTLICLRPAPLSLRCSTSLALISASAGKPE